MQQTKPYTALARIYDHVMDHVEYQKWAEYIKSVIEYTGIRAKKILDISCGTGEFLKYLEKEKYWLLAADLSPHMLQVFRQKQEIKRIPVLAADAGAIPVQPDTFDIVFMLYDSLNYQLEHEHLTQSLHEINRVLKKGGFFIFDTVTRKHCRTHFSREVEEQFWQDYGYRRRSRYDRQKNLQHNEFDIYIAERHYHESHVQRIYSRSELRKMLAKSRLKVVHIFDEFTLHKATRHAQRIHFVCKKR